MEQPTPPVAVWTITGNYGIDGLIRSGAIAVTALITGICFTWLNAHGFNDPNLALMISGAVGSAVLGLVVVLWSWIKNTQLGRIITHHEQVAVQAGINVGAAGYRTSDAAPLTPATTKEIIKNFAKPTPPGADPVEVTKALNLEQLKRTKPP